MVPDGYRRLQSVLQGAIWFHITSDMSTNSTLINAFKDHSVNSITILWIGYLFGHEMITRCIQLLQVNPPQVKDHEVNDAFGNYVACLGSHAGMNRFVISR